MTDEPRDIQLPAVIEEYLSCLTGRIRNRRVRADVVRELRGHFLDALAEVEIKDRDQVARGLIREFGEPELLAELIKRAKKRCRPAWQKFLIRSGQAGLGLIILLVGYSGWLLLDKPSPTVDYVAELNAQARPVADDSQNGAPFYVRANERFVDHPKDLDKSVIMNPGIRLTTQEEKAVRQWLHQNEPALEWVTKGSQKPHAWFTYTGEDAISILLPHLGTMRSFARLICWRIWLMDGEDQEKILADIRSVYAMAGHLQETGPTLIEQLVGNAINSIATAQIRMLLKTGRIQDESLASLAKILDEIYPNGYPKMTFQGEMVFGLDIIQRTFTDGGMGGGHLCPLDLNRYLKFLNSEPHEERDLWPQLVSIFTHPGREETLRKLREYYVRVEHWNILPHDRGLKIKSPYEDFRARNKNNLILSVFLPSFDRAVDQNYHGRAEFDATRTVVALLRYKHDRGRYPETLKELVPAYLKQLPRDPYGPDTLSYRRTGEDFLLYSRAMNLRDDGGKHLPKWGIGVGQDGKTIIEDGDYVFWPPVMPERK